MLKVRTIRPVIILLLALSMTNVVSQINRIEPPFWWADMKRDSLELMFYGEGISEFTPSSKEAKIIRVDRTNNPNYLFITLDTDQQSAGMINFKFEKDGQSVFSSKYEFRERRPGSRERRGFDSSDVIYLLMPDRFSNGDPSNDSHPEMHEGADRSNPGGRHGGDLKGIMNHLDYIKDLGATAIWSTPLCEDNDERGSYHGYAQSDVYRIDPRIGTNEEYALLSAELHKREMKLIMDYVANHWGLEHWMIKDLPDQDWIHQFPEYRQTNHRMTVQIDPNASEYDRKHCIEGWFVPSMPDLNSGNPRVLSYLIQNAIWWIEFADLDGFRVDTYSYNHKDHIASWTKAIMDEYPNFNIVGEIWMHHQAQIAYWQKDSQLGAIQDYNSHLPSVMDFTLHDALMKAFKEEGEWNTGMVRLYDNFVNDFLYPNIQNILVFAENHDTPRINELYPDLADYKLIISMIATVRGIPQIYYGSEIGMRGEKSKGDGDIRRDFPGGWPKDPQNAFDPEGRTELQNKYYNFTSKLLNWRRSAPAIHYGQMTQYTPQDNVFVYFRTLDQESVMVILNPNTTESSLDMERFQENLRGFKYGIDVNSGHELELGPQWDVQAKSALILELRK